MRDAAPVPLGGARILVTGASSGIGLALTNRLIERGARVAVAGRQGAVLEELAARSGGPAVVADLAQPGEPARVVAESAGALGGLDIVVNNAGIGWAGRFEEMPVAELDRLLDVNLRSALQVTRAALPHLREAERAHLVFIGSIAGLVAVRREAVYSATKAALNAFAEALRGELAGSAIAVSVVNPAAVATPFLTRRNRPYLRSWPRPMPAAAVVQAVLRCLETGRPEVVVPGWMTIASRLHGALPGVYRRLADRWG